LDNTAIPAVFMRGGTSKGIFLHESHLPPPGTERDALLLRLMGSPDPYGRQLNGMGGGISSLSKVIILRRAAPDDPDAEVEFIHGQVAVDRDVVDWSANCGNLSVAVGPFALDEGLVAPVVQDGLATIRIRNLNSGTLIGARVPVRAGRYNPFGDFSLAGVAGRGARVALDYARPGVPGTSALFPTGRASEEIALPGGPTVRVTLAHATLPMVWLCAEDVGVDATASPDAIEVDARALAWLEALRREGAVRMGLAASPEEARLAAPKIGMIAAPRDAVALDGRPIPAGEADIVARVISMGRPHKAIPLTGAMCLAAATQVPGSVPHDLATRWADGAGLRVSTPSGVVTVDALVGPGEAPEVLRVTTYSTARRLMDGRVYPGPAA
jgi:2-methylaconitate cis-trans-isomerase PrpF